MGFYRKGCRKEIMKLFEDLKRVRTDRFPKLVAFINWIYIGVNVRILVTSTWVSLNFEKEALNGNQAGG